MAQRPSIIYSYLIDEDGSFIRDEDGSLIILSQRDFHPVWRPHSGLGNLRVFGARYLTTEAGDVLTTEAGDRLSLGTSDIAPKSRTVWEKA